MFGDMFYTYLFAINVLAFYLYGLDKQKACYERNRIPEIVLVGIALMGGAYGALMGMLLFRHKTLHKLFKIAVPASLIVWMLILVAVLVL